MPTGSFFNTITMHSIKIILLAGYKTDLPFGAANFLFSLTFYA
jgi:hypothetical protein